MDCCNLRCFDCEIDFCIGCPGNHAHIKSITLDVKWIGAGFRDVHVRSVNLGGCLIFEKDFPAVTPIEACRLEIESFMSDTDPCAVVHLPEYSSDQLEHGTLSLVARSSDS